MTTESNDNDPRVSGAYRSIATETTPEELDRKILAMAAGKSRSRYGMARAWIRPVAWAATIGLSLAIVLEVSRVNDVATPQADADSVEIIDEALIRQKTPSRAKTSEFQRVESEKLSIDPVPAQSSPAAAKPVNSPPAEEEPASRAEPGQKREQAGVCDQESRSSAASWYACIEELRHEGLADAADRELESLLLDFPDFEGWVQNK